MTKLPENLDMVLEDIANETMEQIDAINSGGCGVFACEVATRLQERGIPVTVRVANHDTDAEIAPLEELELPTLRAYNENGVSMDHVILELERDGKLLHYDATGLHPAGDRDPVFRLPLYSDTLSIVSLQRITARPEGWNSWFNREQIPTLRRIIDKHMEALVNE